MRVIYCAGEQGRVVLDILRSVGETDDIVFADDDPALHGESVAGRPVVGGLDELPTGEESVAAVVAFGDQPGVRLDLADRLADAGCEFFSAVHAAATVSETASLGCGVMLNADSYLGPGVEVGDHVLVDSCVNISHDASLRRGVTVTPGATVAGGVTLGVDSYVGPGATVVEDVHIGEGAVVGAGAVVTEDVPPETTVVGVPAAPLE
jgi:sugar O-acyltransferase (sialic acid O-acetyltransferase NeuD family)